MPLYDYRCSWCDHEWEEFAPVAKREFEICPSCGFGSGQITLSPFSPYTIESGWNSDIEAWVNGPKDYKKFLKDNHMEEIY